MYCNTNSFWPTSEGDNHCPRCGYPLLIIEEFPCSRDYSVYKLRCFECGEYYLVGSETVLSMHVKLLTLDDALTQLPPAIG